MNQYEHVSLYFFSKKEPKDLVGALQFHISDVCFILDSDDYSEQEKQSLVEDVLPLLNKIWEIRNGKC
jgi:hypothetical protein